MTALRARLAVLAVFVAGAVTGAAALQAYRLRVESRLLHAPDPAAQIIVYKLDQELSLSATQRDAVREAIHASRNDFLHMRAGLLPQLIEVFEKGQGRIRGALTPAQRVKFDALVGERRRLLQDIVKKSGIAEPAPRSPSE